MGLFVDYLVSDQQIIYRGNLFIVKPPIMTKKAEKWKKSKKKNRKFWRICFFEQEKKFKLPD